MTPTDTEALSTKAPAGEHFAESANCPAGVVEALERLINEIVGLEEHGDGADDVDCPVCEAIANGQRALASIAPAGKEAHLQKIIDQLSSDLKDAEDGRRAAEAQLDAPAGPAAGVERDLLRRLNDWFLSAAPEQYRGCGLHIDVEAALSAPVPTDQGQPSGEPQGVEADDELMPCPFCGGEAEVIDIAEGENEGGSCVSCTVCQASSNLEFGRKENFRSNWNRRAALVHPVADAPSQPSGVVEALANRLREAADWLSEDIPEGTPEVQHLEGDVRLDELDLYCVNLMREAAEAINGYARAIGIASTALETIQGMEPITHEITLATVMAQHAVDALSDIAALSSRESDNG